jgi:hypothetical protein
MSKADTIDAWHSKRIDGLKSWETTRGKQFGNCDTGPGWYVGFRDPLRDKSLFIPLRFGRQLDADRCVTILRDKMPAKNTTELVGMIDEIGPQEFRKMMVEDLAW